MNFAALRTENDLLIPPSLRNIEITDGPPLRATLVRTPKMHEMF